MYSILNYRRKILLGSALAAALSTNAGAVQSDRAVDLTAEQIAKVLEVGRDTTDHNIKVIDMGKYQLSVAIVHRSSIQKANGDDIPESVPKSCGRRSHPGEPLGPSSIEHSATDEVYIITSGSGTLVTGGEIVDGVQSNPAGPVAKVLNGPSCRGKVAGAFTSRVVKAGDISVIPAGVPHGWTKISQEVTYLSVRPDIDRVLPRDYINPALATK